MSKAADPAAQRVAATRLERMAPAAKANFASAIAEEFAADRPRRARRLPPSAAERSRRRRSSGRLKKAIRLSVAKFEAFVLQMFVETMLPKDAEDVFGKGTAGSIW